MKRSLISTGALLISDCPRWPALLASAPPRRMCTRGAMRQLITSNAKMCESSSWLRNLHGSPTCFCHGVSRELGIRPARGEAPITTTTYRAQADDCFLIWDDSPRVCPAATLGGCCFMLRRRVEEREWDPRVRIRNEQRTVPESNPDLGYGTGRLAISAAAAPPKMAASVCAKKKERSLTGSWRRGRPLLVELKAPAGNPMETAIVSSSCEDPRENMCIHSSSLRLAARGEGRR